MSRLCIDFMRLTDALIFFPIPRNVILLVFILLAAHHFDDI